MPSRIAIVLALAFASGCKYEFVENPNEAAEDEDSSEADSSEADTSGANGSEGDRDEAGTGETDGSNETGEPQCGNGFVEAPEECDQQDFSGRDCTTLGFVSGQLACTEQCKLDTMMCM